MREYIVVLLEPVIDEPLDDGGLAHMLLAQQDHLELYLAAHRNG